MAEIPNEKVECPKCQAELYLEEGFDRALALCTQCGARIEPEPDSDFDAWYTSITTKLETLKVTGSEDQAKAIATELWDKIQEKIEDLEQIQCELRDEFFPEPPYDPGPKPQDLPLKDGDLVLVKTKDGVVGHKIVSSESRFEVHVPDTPEAIFQIFNRKKDDPK